MNIQLLSHPSCTLRACCVGSHWIDCMGFPGGANGKEPTCQCRRYKTRSWSLGQEDPRRRAWQPTLVFLPREPQPSSFHPVHEVAKSRTWLEWLSTHASCTDRLYSQTAWVHCLYLLLNSHVTLSKLIFLCLSLVICKLGQKFSWGC